MTEKQIDFALEDADLWRREEVYICAECMTPWFAGYQVCGCGDPDSPFASTTLTVPVEKLRQVKEKLGAS